MLDHFLYHVNLEKNDRYEGSDDELTSKLPSLGLKSKLSIMVEKDRAD